MANGLDTLPKHKDPDRVNYATGVLLAAEDFQAEQDYHRSRLARALRFTMGYGTAAGLRVRYEAEQEETTTTSYRPERIVVEPGMGIDRLGRQLEVGSNRCLKLRNWYEANTPQQLRDAWHDAGNLWTGSPSGVGVDVFLRFYVCEQGKTPAFAADAFDSFDSVTAARLRDGIDIDIVLRSEASPPLPAAQWPDFASDPQNLRDAIYEAWEVGTEHTSDGELNPLDEHVPGQDTTSILLARIVIPADQSPAGQRPQRRDGEDVVINNDIRPFVVTPMAIAHWLGITVSAQS